ncbi:mitochondrial enolase superfamily member 1 [Grus japonensis]|uniref:Mitochondrial enolase superfamily member 1 n=1 Tax=Grus japonensis TaxID=30415 RepID=A0ABC9X4S7_GRUJA
MAFCDEKSGSVNEGKAADNVYFDAGKAFSTVSHNILIDKLMEVRTRQLEGVMDWLTCQAQSSRKSSWGQVTSRVPQGLILGPIQFNISINALDDGTECTPSKPTDDTEGGGMADAPDGCAAIQRDLDKMEEWADGNIVKFNKVPCT